MSRSLIPVNRVGVDERAAALGRRSIKTTAKREGIRIATSMIDLTTLEGADTPGKVRHLCAKAVCPDPARPEIPSCAAVCVYPALVAVAARGAARHRRRGRLGVDRLPGRPDVARRQGRGDPRRGRRRRDRDRHGDLARGLPGAATTPASRDEIEAVKEACGDAHLKVILETAELPTYAHVRHASQLAIDAGRRRDQDLDRQGAPGRHAGRRPGDARDRARPPVADRPRRRRQGRRRRLARPRRRCTCSCSSRRRSATSG